MADFAAAQQRIIERRAAREQALTAADRQHHELRAQQLSRLPPTLRSLTFELLSYWDGLSSPYGTRPAYRVGQVDAELLDEALLGLLKKQAGEGLKLYGAHLKDDWNAEITVALRAVLWKLSIWDHGASYGASLQGLKYIDSRRNLDSTSVNEREATKWQRAIYGIITVGGRYAWTRWEDRLSALENSYDEPSSLTRKLSRLTTIFDSGHNIAAFISFLVFLYNGRYRTLTDRILRLRLVPASNQTSREVSFEWLNRQLVWHAFTEFLLFLLPLVGISRWKRWVARAWKKTKNAFVQLRTGATSAEQDDEDDLNKGELAFLPERTCAICYSDQNPAGGQSEQELISSTSAGANSGIIGSAMTDITNPYEADPCGCVYCFVCLAQKIEAEEGEGWICLRCGEVVKECRPWSGDVVVSKARQYDGSDSRSMSRSRKSVMFDLDDEQKRVLEEELEEQRELKTVDPMPMEETSDSLQWSKVEGDYDDHDGEEYGSGSGSEGYEEEYDDDYQQ
ncbi:peroxisomal biogenesis factor 2 like protein [Zymoseptoria brevis]|uniref:Peroxisomal biogenesis factor 2 like protein n=1 Tax=Zymoseptoria brevis TaxID=1047168 RepID=A0A0F4GMW4_9PEZI|nr:peroxisomal biogenesis factor 2 like protein [Zymoseptoria brevis]